MANFNRPRDNYRRRMKRRRKEARRLSNRSATTSLIAEKKETPATKTMGGESKPSNAAEQIDRAEEKTLGMRMNCGTSNPS